MRRVNLNYTTYLVSALVCSYIGEKDCLNTFLFLFWSDVLCTICIGKIVNKIEDLLVSRASRLYHSFCFFVFCF